MMGTRVAADLALPRSPRYASLDIWRGVACLLVVVFHSAYYAAPANFAEGGGEGWLLEIIRRLWIGVPLFFVISGYCISATADATRRRPRPLSQYFTRRFRRIFPPYWIVLGLSFIAVASVECYWWPGLFVDANHGIPKPWRLSAAQWLGNLSLTEGWRPHLAGPECQYLLGPAWTLCYEEQFYVVTGLLLLFAARRFFAGAAIVSVLIAVVWFAASLCDIPIDGCFFDGRWFLFAAGILVYYRINYSSRRQAWLIDGLFAAVLIGLVMRPEKLRGDVGNLHQSALAASSFALLIGLIHPWDLRLASATALKPFAFCGTICYSLYLVHWPIVKAISHACQARGLDSLSATLCLTIPLCVISSLAAAWLFHLTVERRFLNLATANNPRPVFLGRLYASCRMESL